MYVTFVNWNAGQSDPCYNPDPGACYSLHISGSAGQVFRLAADSLKITLLKIIL